MKDVIGGPALKTIYKPKVEGLENIPDEGRAIIASNHLSVSDSFFFPIFLSRPISFFAKSDYFYSPGVKGALKAKFFTSMGQIPVDRSGGDKTKDSFDSAEGVLAKGGLFGIYPEGTRSSDGKLHKGHTGVARIALTTHTPVIPIAMINTNIAQPIGKLIPSRHPRIGIKIGKPMDFSQYYDQAKDHAVLRKVTDEIMMEIQKLGGQEYVDEYSAPATKRLDESEKVIRD
ncbi:MAG: lysophospholipid acyltransferase family protein [Micrococcaceae bacterium]